MNLLDSTEGAEFAAPVQLFAAKGEWISFCAELGGFSFQSPGAIRITSNSPGSPIENAEHEAYQVLSMPLKITADFIRQNGATTARTMPAALLPLSIRQRMIDLSTLRHENPMRLWIDLHVPEDSPAGEYVATCEWTDSNGRVQTTLPIQLTIYDFALPAQRHLQIVGRLDWQSLAEFYPDAFGSTISPPLVNRREARYEQTVELLDQFIDLAHSNRLNLFVDQLRPTVKWPADGPPLVDWREFDSLVEPWLDGRQFPDHVRQEDWPMPVPPLLDQHATKAQQDYWSMATTHFKQHGWPVQNHASDHALTFDREPDVRFWPWLTFIGEAASILCNGDLPRSDSPRASIDPESQPWFYPGKWFGPIGRSPASC